VKLNFKSKMLVHILLTIGSIFMVVPFLWMVLTSVKTFGESISIPLIVFPKKLQWVNYKNVLIMLPFLNFYFNTVITTLAKTVGQLIFCSMAAYAFARIKFPGRNLLFIILLSVLMVPGQIFLIPNYKLIQSLGLLNTLWALIIPGLFSAYGVFLLRQFFMTLPKELEDAAIIDGCNQFQIYWKIMLPLAKPGLIALSIFTILWSWNDLLWPLVVNTSLDKLPLSVGIATLQGQYLTDYPTLMAGSVLAMWPMILMFIIFQKKFIEGIAITGSKN
jgi:multiple sugar transport system permease protein